MKFTSLMRRQDQRRRCWPTQAFLLSCAIASVTAHGAVPAAQDNLATNSHEAFEKPSFDPGSAPNASEWRRFMEMPTKEIEALWYSNAHRGNTLASWDWKWRLGWVRICAAPSGGRPEFCSKILENGLQDKALVVRAEAAGAIGTAMEGSMDAPASRKLLATLRDRRNLRSGVPVMVQKRALYSIFKIGHSDSIKEAAAIAGSTPELKTYWEKLTST
ncbi:MAG: hypothetical protein RIQ81_49 [Pseudomonadota bacterium]|jgi:hypothetical protein